MGQAARFDSIEPPEMERLVECIHCGLCLSSCPTYRELGVETDSPRGRLYLMRAVSEERLSVTDAFVEHMYLCLNCRNCEYVCPSGVKFGHVMEKTRAQIERNYPRPLIQKISRRIVFGELFPHPSRLNFAFKMLGIYQRSGLQGLVHKLGILRYLPGHLDRLEEMLPRIPSHFFSPEDYEVVKPVGEKRFRVGFVTGCIMSTVYADVNRATVRVLARNGCEVVTPRGQNCCAAIHTHNGERTFAREMARRNIEAFERAGVDYILTNSAGCGAMLKEYKDLLEGDPEFGARAKEFSAKVRDVQEFLAGAIVNKNFRPIARRATYQDPCHLAHVQRVRKQPRDLIKMIPGLELVEMKESDMCCGGAGTYAITQYDLSMKILDTKIDNIKSTGTDLIIAPNPPCLLQLSLGVKRAGLKADVVHLMQLLDDSYTLAEKGRT